MAEAIQVTEGTMERKWKKGRRKRIVSNEVRGDTRRGKATEEHTDPSPKIKNPTHEAKLGLRYDGITIVYYI